MFAAAADPRLETPVGRDRITAPPARPARPFIDRSVRESVLDLENYVLLAPFVAWQERTWTETHWRRLAFLINQTGREVVAIGTKKSGNRLHETCSSPSPIDNTVLSSGRI